MRVQKGRKSEDGITQNSQGLKRRDLLLSGTSLVAASLLGAGFATPAQAQQPTRTLSAGQQPNILVIMGDDIGWENLGSYHQGLMLDATPNLDKLASEGMRFTDYYAEASCTAGRANFITGELPIRTGLTTVGQAGSPLGMPEQRRRLPPRSRRLVMPPANSAKITSATGMSICRQTTASTNTSAISIT
jgi:hypothetical protein